MRRVDVMRHCWCLLVLCSVGVPKAAAWDAGVHELICEMAWQQLQPATRHWLRVIRAGDTQGGKTFASSCAWADVVRTTDYRDTYEYHFVNIARGANEVSLARDCPALDCLPVAVHRYLRYLVARDDDEFGRARRVSALRFLGHFVGDLHQPLHVAYRSDRGGNALIVQFRGQRTSLHALWDGDIPASLGLGGVFAARALLADLRARDAAQWRKPDIQLWTNESFTLARQRAYPMAAHGAVDANEIAQLRPVVQMQLLKASVRLAWLLDGAAAGRYALTPLWQ